MAAILIGLAASWLALVKHPSSPESGHWIKAVTEQGAQPLLIQGVLSPVNSVDIVAPSEGVLRAKYVQFGDRVTTGQRIAQVSDSELMRQLREAEIAAIQAKQALIVARQLESSTEYRAAARRLLAAQSTLAHARHRGVEAQMLFDKGIIARTEVDASKQEIDTSVSQVDGARDEIATLELKRSGAALRVLELDLENRQAHLEELRASLKATTMLSPIAGVVLYPTTEGSDTVPPKILKSGTVVTPKDVIATVGDTSAFVIKTWVDEGDASQVEPGQAAHIVLATSAHPEFAGLVQHVSSQARPADDHGQDNRGMAEFEVRILLKPPTGSERLLHVGSSVNVTITPSPGPPTLRIPLTAVGWNTLNRPVVRVRHSASGQSSIREIAVKRTLVDSVEVKSGLSAGDEVWVPAALPATGGSDNSGALNRLLSGSIDA
ncbi:efflux RND transporter periplasmic adaptor subunit [Paraburkholderia sp. JPY465]|uniref:efflux RND transporter periplasmic adaptor subunit n=1 Tax=Paraburkholderia sp. JPY465 TaxID=3042285 RepID=UPI003D233FF2